MFMINLRIILVTLFFLFITACSPADIQNQISSAEKSFAEKEYRRAVIILKSLIAEHPENIKARHLLGEVYLIVSDGDAAEKEFNKYIEYGGKDVDIALKLARASLMQNKPERVMEILTDDAEQVIASKNQFHTLQGQAFLAQNMLSLAIKSFEKALLINKDTPEAIVGLAQIELVGNKTKLALSRLKKLTKSHSQFAKGWFVLGQAYTQNKQVSRAFDAFEKSAKIYGEKSYGPDALSARFTYINKLIARKKLDQAEREVELLERSYVNHPLVYYISGLYLHNKKQYDLAEGKFHKALKLSENHMPSFLMLGAVNYAKGRYEQANKYLTQYVSETSNNSSAKKMLASTQIMLNRKNDALSVLKTVPEEDQDAETLAMFGQLALTSGFSNLAVSSLQKAVEKKPDDEQLKSALAAAYLKKGEFSNAIKELNKLSGTEKEKSSYLLIDAYLNNRDFVNARRQAMSLMRENPGDTKAITSIGVVEMVSGNMVKAREYFDKAVAVSAVVFTPAMIHLAKIDFIEGKLADAEERLHKVLEEDSVNLQALLGLMQIASKRGEHKKAVSWLKQAYQNSKNALAPSILLASLYLNTGEIENAVKVLESAVKSHPASIKAGLLLARAYRLSRKSVQALAIYTDMIAKEPRLITAYIEKADTLMVMKRYDQAKVTIKDALELYPDTFQLKSVLGLIEFKEGNLQSAIDIAREIQQNKKGAIAGYVLEGDVRQYQKKFKKAQQSYLKAFQINDGMQIIYRLANAYRRGGEPDKAIDILEKRLLDIPKDVSLMVYLAETYLRQKKYNRAIGLYERILKENPKHLVSLNNLANLYIDTELSKALEFAQRAYAVDSNNPDIQDTLGWAYIKNNSAEKGLSVLEQASKGSDSPTIQYHYAVALKKTGQNNQARKVLIKLLKTEKFFPEREDAVLMLDKLGR